MTATISTILDKAADLIEPEGKWGGGECAGPNCAQTAISEVERRDGDALDFFAKYLGAPDSDRPLASFRFIWDWNDAPERTQPEVVAKLREAANVARERGL